MSKQPSNLQSDCFWLIEAELVTSFFALSVRHRRHNPPKKVMSLRRGSSLPLPTSLKLKPPVLCWTSLTENIKDLKSCNLRWICWWETLLWYCYGFLKQLSLTPSWCHTFRVPQSYIIGQNSNMTLEKIFLQTHHFFGFYILRFTIFTCSWHRAASLLILRCLFEEEELLKHWQRTNHPNL